MGCCQNFVPIDYYSLTENSLKFSSVPVDTFIAQLQEVGNNKECSIADLQHAFTAFDFGQELQRGDPQSNLMKLLKYTYLQAKNSEELSKDALFALAMLYCGGSTSQKQELLFRKCDANKDGQIANTSLKKFYRYFVVISGVIIPAISADREDISNDEETDEIQDLLQQMILATFDSQIIVTRANFKHRALHQIKYIFQPAIIRRELSRVSKQNLSAS